MFARLSKCQQSQVKPTNQRQCKVNTYLFSFENYQQRQLFHNLCNKPHPNHSQIIRGFYLNVWQHLWLARSVSQLNETRRETES